MIPKREPRDCTICGAHAGNFSDEAWLKYHQHCDRDECIVQCEKCQEWIREEAS